MGAVHLLILLLTACAIAFADHMGWEYMRGTKQTLNPVTVGRLHLAVWVGLCGMILTGGLLAYDRINYLLGQPAFILKMVFVLVLIVNATFIGRLSKKSTSVPYAALSARERLYLNLSAGASTISWLGAATIGLFFL